MWRVWIDADTQGAVTSLRSIMESDAVSANGKWGVPVEDPYGSNHFYTFSRNGPLKEVEDMRVNEETAMLRVRYIVVYCYCE